MSKNVGINFIAIKGGNISLDKVARESRYV